MTLTIKEPSPLNTLTKPGSTARSSESNSDRTTRSNPVCLEVAVTIRSLPGEKGEASSGSAQPTREETRTVIVFDNGAVLRLAGNFPPGQAVILSNPQGREVVCRVVSARNLPNVKGYIEVEFQEPIIDFWGIHRPAEQANVLKSPAAVVPQPQAVPQAPIVSSEPPPSAPTAPARMASSVPEIDLSTWNAPSFNDIAGLDRTPPPPIARAKAPEPASRIPVSRNPDESKKEIAEPARSYSTANASGPASDLTSLSGSWDGTPPLSKKPSSSSDILGKFSGSETASVTSSSKSRGKTPLIVAGAAVVLIGLGTGLFFMHRGSPVMPSAAPVAAVTQSITPNRPVPTSVPALSAVARGSVDQPPAAPVLSSESEVSKESVAASTSSLPQTTHRPVMNADAIQPDRPTQRPQLTHNLKMKAPTVDSRAGRLVDSSVPSIDDVAAIGGVNGTPGVGLISTVSHASNPPPPPAAFAGPTSSGKIANEPKLVSSPRPAYPQLAKQANVEGDVLVAAEIDAAGNVVRAKAVGGPMFLQQAAADAVRKWKYEPATLDGRPASAHITIKIQFRLK